MWTVVELGTTSAAAVLGLAVGAQLTVLVPRAERGDPLLRPWPHFPGPGRDFSRADLGLVAVAGGAFAVLAWRLGPGPLLPAYLYLGAVGVLSAVVDIRTHRLPDAITLPSYVVGTVLVGAGALFAERGGARFAWALAGMAALYLAYLALRVLTLLIERNGQAIGFGDVKLAGILGLYLGWFGPGALVAGVLSGHLLGGTYGLTAVAARRAARKTPIPFGPFMIAGALVGVLAGERLAGLYLSW